MKILIAYDGSECSDAAIIDLRRAGLPADCEAAVLCVAEAPSKFLMAASGAMVGCPGMLPTTALNGQEYDECYLPAAKSLSKRALHRLRSDFPTWRLSGESWVDDPGSAILRKIHSWKPDLVVVGSHGRAPLSRLMLGSVSTHVLNHTDCSVRISRHHLHSQMQAVRLIVGVDGSSNSAAAVREISKRKWPTGTQVWAVGVVDPYFGAVTTATRPGQIQTDAVAIDLRDRLETAVEDAALRLTRAGLVATPLMLVGRPADVLLEQAEIWSVDCVFLGAGSLNVFERLMLGSVCSAVAARAHCSVEVVRPEAV